MSKTLLFLLFFSIVSVAQNNTIDYIAYSDNTYYEILKHKKSVSVIKYFIDESRFTRDTLDFISLKEAQKKLHFETLLKTGRLQKESKFYKNEYPEGLLKKPNFGDLAKTEKLPADWNLRRSMGIDFKTNTDTLYTFQLQKNGTKELWYLSGDDNTDYNERLWCKPKKQPLFIPVRNKKFDVILVLRDAKLSLIYFDRKKGIQGYIRF